MRNIIIFIVLSLSSFIYYFNPIQKNTVFFTTDEMYWISSARTLHMLIQKDFHNPLWREYYGFANLNGAKIIYGAGLILFGHNNVSSVGIAPQTYYRWVSYEGSPFPTNHPLYRLLRDARIITAFFMSASIGIVFAITTILSVPYLLGIAASIIVALHPVSMYLASHVFADAMFIFFQLILLCLLFQLRKNKLSSIILEISIGFIFAWVISVKLNGLLFTPIILLLLLRIDKLFKRYIHQLCVIAISTFIFLALINPNFLFYPSYTPHNLLTDRIKITHDHIAYFSRVDPSHVTLSFQSRLFSLIRHLFTPWLAVISSIAFLSFIYTFYKQKAPFHHILWFISLIIITEIILIYTVFDEQRYYYPIVPFIAIFVACGLDYIRMDLSNPRAV